jgi:hypothetical protein
MRAMRAVVTAGLASILGIALTGCGIVFYPGQEGVVTNSYSKIDLEDLEADGLFVYEVVYDNRVGGKGVGAVITKLYPRAKTYTSNVRTNADGTLYRHKSQYDGAEVQMISIPALQQIHLNPNNKLAFFIQYDMSMDEVDDKNESERSLFTTPTPVAVTGRAMARFQLMRDLLAAGTLTTRGSLAFEISAVEFGTASVTLTKPVRVETNLFQNAIRTQLTPDQKVELLTVLELKYPKGYQGPVNFKLKSPGKQLSFSMGLHTPRTLESAGYQVIRSSVTELDKLAVQYGGQQ